MSDETSAVEAAKQNDDLSNLSIAALGRFRIAVAQSTKLDPKMKALFQRLTQDGFPTSATAAELRANLSDSPDAES